MSARITEHCKRCTKETGRHPGCHSKCERYKEYREEIDKRNREIADYQLKRAGLYIYGNKTKECIKNADT